MTCINISMCHEWHSLVLAIEGAVPSPSASEAVPAAAEVAPREGQQHDEPQDT